MPLTSGPGNPQWNGADFTLAAHSKVRLKMLAAGGCEAVITGRCFVWDLAPALPFTRRLGYVERHLDGSSLRMQSLLSRDYGLPHGSRCSSDLWRSWPNWCLPRPRQRHESAYAD